jgi:serine/threonine protein kinase
MLPLAPDDPRRIVHYTVHGRLGVGGMGVVYAAAESAGRQVAVKVIRREFASDSGFRTRFSREVAVMRRVRGVCVTSVLTADTDAAQPWFATDFRPGPDPKSHVAARGPLPSMDFTGFKPLSE